MIKQLLSRFGIGAPQIERVEHDPQIARGEILVGQIHLLGGRTAVRIDEIALSLQTEVYYFQGEVRRHVLSLREQTLRPNLYLQPGEAQVLAFELPVPMETPISLSLAQVWLRTELELPWAVDPKDHDPVCIVPEQATQHVLQAVSALGFEATLSSGGCLAQSELTEIGLPGLTQVFKFVPGAHLEHSLHEIQDLALLVRANHYDAEIQLEINREGQLPAGWLPDGARQDQRRLRFRLRHNERFPASGLEELLLKAAGHNLHPLPIRPSSKSKSESKP